LLDGEGSVIDTMLINSCEAQEGLDPGVSFIGDTVLTGTDDE